MEEEIWKDIKGYEGYYIISNFGRVKSLDRYIERIDGKSNFVKSRFIAIQYNKRNNVYMVMLNKNGKRTAFNLHQLVAKNFIPSDDPIHKTTVNHIDGDRSNNRVDNLEWDTYSENLKHAYDVLHRPINIGKGKRKCKSINKLNNEIIEYESIAEASRKTGISETQIRRLIDKECVNKTYEFEYIN